MQQVPIYRIFGSGEIAVSIDLIIDRHLVIALVSSDNMVRVLCSEWIVVSVTIVMSSREDDASCVGDISSMSSSDSYASMLLFHMGYYDSYYQYQRY